MESLSKEKLPVPWTYAITNDGRVFFINDETRETTWLHPVWDQALQTGHFFNQGIPCFCEMDFALGNMPYYIDHRTKTTSWQAPLYPINKTPPSPKQESIRGISPLKRSNSARRRSLKQRAPYIKRNRDALVVERGWIFKQEGGLGPLKSWKKRWCVLSELCLFIYKGSDEGELIGSILLPSYKIIPCPKDKTNQKFVFKAEHDNMKSEYFSMETIEEAEKWMEVMTLAAMAVNETNQTNNNSTDNIINNVDINLNNQTGYTESNNVNFKRPIVGGSSMDHAQGFNMYGTKPEQIPVESMGMMTLQSPIQANLQQANMNYDNNMNKLNSLPQSPPITKWNEDVDSQRKIEIYETEQLEKVILSLSQHNKTLQQPQPQHQLQQQFQGTQLLQHQQHVRQIQKLEEQQQFQQLQQKQQQQMDYKSDMNAYIPDEQPTNIMPNKSPNTFSPQMHQKSSISNAKLKDDDYNSNNQPLNKLHEGRMGSMKQNLIGPEVRQMVPNITNMSVNNEQNNQSNYIQPRNVIKNTNILTGGDAYTGTMELFDSNSFERVKQWTEQQNQFREELIRSNSLDNEEQKHDQRHYTHKSDNDVQNPYTDNFSFNINKDHLTNNANNQDSVVTAKSNSMNDNYNKSKFVSQGNSISFEPLEESNKHQNKSIMNDTVDFNNQRTVQSFNYQTEIQRNQASDSNDSTNVVMHARSSSSPNLPLNNNSKQLNEPSQYAVLLGTSGNYNHKINKYNHSESNNNDTANNSMPRNTFNNDKKYNNNKSNSSITNTALQNSTTKNIQNMENLSKGSAMESIKHFEQPSGISEDIRPKNSNLNESIQTRMTSPLMTSSTYNLQAIKQPYHQHQLPSVQPQQESHQTKSNDENSLKQEIIKVDIEKHVLYSEKLISSASVLFHTDQIEQILQLLIQLRRNQSALHECSYNLMSFLLQQQDPFGEIQKQIDILDQQASKNSKVLQNLEAYIKEKSSSKQSMNFHGHDPLTSNSYQPKFNLHSMENKYQNLDHSRSSNHNNLSVTNEFKNLKPVKSNDNFIDTHIKDNNEDSIATRNIFQSMQHPPHSRSGITTLRNEEQSTYFETNLDSMETKDIAKFTYGVQQSDITSSPALKHVNSHNSPFYNLVGKNNVVNKGYEVQANNNRSINPNQTIFDDKIKPTTNQIAYNSYMEKNNIKIVEQALQPHYTNISRSQQQRNMQYHDCINLNRQHVDSNIQKSVNKFESLNEPCNVSHGEASTDGKLWEKSLSKESAEKTRHNIGYLLRNAKSTQDLKRMNNENESNDNQNDELETGFHDRQHARRLSGIFTPRPFYKSQSSNNLNQNINSEELGKTSNDIFDIDAAIQVPKKIDIPERYNSSRESESYEDRIQRHEKSEHIKKLVAAQSLTQFNNAELTSQEGDLKQRVEDEKLRRQQMLDVRLDIARQASYKAKKGF